jgi:hypothetical protein
MKIYISLWIMCTGLCAGSQNLTSSDQIKLDQILANKSTLDEKSDLEGWILFETQNRESVFFNKKGVLQLNLGKRFDWVDGFYGSELAKVSKNNRLGFINKKGEVVIPFDFENVKVFSNGLAAVMMLGKHGFIDTTGKLVIPFLYEDAGYFGNGLAPVKKNGNFGFIDRKGTLAIPYKYDDAKSFYNGRAAVKLDTYNSTTAEEVGKWGFIDTTGKLIIPYKYAVVGNFTSNFTVKVALPDGSSSGDVHFIDVHGNRL